MSSGLGWKLDDTGSASAGAAGEWTRVGILGGSVSGLAAALLARHALLGASGCVHEVQASERVGGWFRASARAGRGGPLLERGPHSLVCCFS